LLWISLSESRYLQIVLSSHQIEHLCLDGLEEKFEEKAEGPRYQKWLKWINTQVEKRKLDLEELHKQILASCGLNKLAEEEHTTDVPEPDIMETLDRWI